LDLKVNEMFKDILQIPKSQCILSKDLFLNAQYLHFQQFFKKNL